MHVCGPNSVELDIGYVQENMKGDHSSNGDVHVIRVTLALKPKANSSNGDVQVTHVKLGSNLQIPKVEKGIDDGSFFPEDIPALGRKSPKGKVMKKREPRVKVESLNWHYNDLVLLEEHFQDKGSLKGVGINAWKDNDVDTKQLEVIFGQKKDSSNGFVVPRTDPNYPWDCMINLC